MSAVMVFKSNGTAVLNPARLCPAAPRAVAVAPTRAEDSLDADSRDWERLAQRFEELTWQSVAAISTVVMTVLCGALFFAHIAVGLG
jgi:hypothetical protein